MSRSIMQDAKECYITHSPSNLHKHHIYAGAFRKKSEHYGCWVWLRSDWHVGTNYCVHNDKNFNSRLKQECQRKFEEKYSHDKFMEVFRKSYL